jgi:ubiquinone/menaquinone biosynthesis C-methylase UbiE
VTTYWDSEAASYDEAPDHGLANPSIRARWVAMLEELLPATGRVLDIGCGTGSLSLLAAGQGHDVVGLDSSSEMLRHARDKALAAGLEVEFLLGDAAVPPMSLGHFDCLIGRHILWALPDPVAALNRWSELLVDGGRLVMIEGFWSTNVGLRMDEVLAALPASIVVERSFSISADRTLWGRDVGDERFVVVATKPPRQ